MNHSQFIDHVKNFYAAHEYVSCVVVTTHVRNDYSDAQSALNFVDKLLTHDPKAEVAVFLVALSQGSEIISSGCVAYARGRFKPVPYEVMGFLVNELRLSEACILLARFMSVLEATHSRQNVEAMEETNAGKFLRALYQCYDSKGTLQLEALEMVQQNYMNQITK